MPKSGDAYQKIVADIIQAFYPEAVVTEGEWVEGPDGRRDRDVTIQGEIDGEEVLALVECKDWKKPVPIGVIDALESKRRDLQAQLCFICSNSGFSAQAIRKSARVGIVPITVLAAGETRIRSEIHQRFFGQVIYIDACHLMVLQEGKDGLAVDPHDLYYKDIPAADWLDELADYLIEGHRERNAVVAVFGLKEETDFVLHGEPIKLIGFIVLVVYMIKWVEQKAQLNASQAIYDYANDLLAVPGGGSVTVRLDDDKWTPLPDDFIIEDFQDQHPGDLLLAINLIDSPLKIRGDVDTEPFHDLIKNELVLSDEEMKSGASLADIIEKHSEPL